MSKSEARSRSGAVSSTVSSTVTAAAAVAVVTLSVLPFLFASSVAGQSLRLSEVPAGDDYSEAIASSRALITELMTEAGIPGASIAVGVGGETVWAEGFGWADVENRVPVTTLTKFRVGSVSKSMTRRGHRASGRAGSARSGRAGSDVCTGLPGEALARHHPAARRPHCRSPALPRNGDAVATVLSNGRFGPGDLCRRLFDLRAGDGLLVFELRLESDQRGHGGCRRTGLSHVHAR